ncbi:MAG: lysophospholipid acyltransferase family protein [Pseudomonadota bacterium]
MSAPADGEPTGYVWTRDRFSVRAGEWLAFAAAWSFRTLTWAVPIWRLSAALAPLGGWIALWLPAAKGRIEENLIHVWPDLTPKARRTIRTEAGRQFLRLCIEYAHLDRWAKSVRIETQGAEHIEAVRESTKGAILVTAHYGNWEAIRLAARAHGVECGIVYRAFNNRYLDRFTQNLIPCAGTPVMTKGRVGMRSMLKHVRQGGSVLILVDQRNSGAPFLPFLGRPAETVTVAASLARTTGAALIPAIARRNAVSERFEVAFASAIETQDDTQAMTAVNARLSAWIEAEPGQWFWFHRRWRSTTRSREQPLDQRS